MADDQTIMHDAEAATLSTVVEPQPTGFDALSTARDWLQNEESIAVATVVRTWGSSPVPAGGLMVIASEDRFQGSVSGGCIENEVILSGCEVIESGTPQLLNFGVANETAWRSGLPCGGNIQVLVARWHRETALPILETITNERIKRRPTVLLTGMSDSTMSLVTMDANPHAHWTRWTAAETIGMERDAQGEFLVHTLMPPPRILIIGAGTIAQHLSGLLLQTGYEAIVIDPRTAYASATRFPATRLITRWPDEAISDLGLDSKTAVVALAHVPEIDDVALKCALASDAFYVGALGSTRNHERRRQRLMDAGTSADQIARIHAPVGLDIGAVTPSEIAMSIAAQIVLARRGAKQAK